MLTKDTITADMKELQEQYSKAQQQLYGAKQQVEDLSATVDRLQGAIMISQKYLAIFDSKVEAQPQPQPQPQTGPQAPAPNGAQAAVPVA